MFSDPIPMQETYLTRTLCSPGCSPAAFNQTGLSCQPFKCPRSLVLCSDTSSPTSHKCLCRCRDWAGQFPGLMYLYLQFAQSSKYSTKPQHHPENTQREAGAWCTECRGTSAETWKLRSMPLGRG